MRTKSTIYRKKHRKVYREIYRGLASIGRFNKNMEEKYRFIYSMFCV